MIKLRPPQSIRFLCKICTCLGSPGFVVTNVERSHAALHDLYLKFVRFIPGANFSIISLIMIYKFSEGVELRDKADSQKVLHNIRGLLNNELSLIQKSD